MSDRIFRQYVFILVAAGNGKEVVDISGIMQDIAPKKGWKLWKLFYQLATDATAHTAGSSVYFNALKNISEAAHHITPTSPGDLSDVRVAGTLFSDFLLCGAGHWADGRVSEIIEHDYTYKPIEFDGDDRMNLEFTLDNKNAAQSDCHLRLFLDVEVL
ncbi:hypothetical protein ES705_41013 [subsurface metagenome]